MTVNNPFIVGKYVAPEYFCDREKETRQLMHHIENERNVALISPRRIGKSGLLAHLFAQQPMVDNYNCFYVDIYATSTLAEFVYLFGKAIFEQLKPRKAVWWEQFVNILSSLRVGVKLDNMTGEPSFSMGLGEITAPETTLDEIFRYLESSEKRCVVAIDEFQQIKNYPESNTEALLRTKIQQCRNTHFIFTGSKRHMMGNMFNSASKPFYQSSIVMGLNPIPMDTYCAFAKGLFLRYSKEVETAVVERVYSMFDGCTWYVQMMMNELFALTSTGEKCTEQLVDKAFRSVVLSQEMSFEEFLANLPAKQKQLMQAVAKEGVVSGITSSAFIKKYALPSASSIQSALKPLLDNDVITRDGNSYRIYNYFLSAWLKEKI